MNLKKLATSGAALVALTAPAFLASQAHADTNPALKRHARCPSHQRYAICCPATHDRQTLWMDAW